jgi:hypothetical protein
MVEPCPGLTITYTTVTTAGHTFCTYSATGTDLPAGYLHGAPPQYWTITPYDPANQATTTVVYSGQVKVCDEYPLKQPGGVDIYFGVGYGGEKGARLLHYENGALRDRTTYLNVNNVIDGGIEYGGEVCGIVENLNFHEFSFAVEEATLATLIGLVAVAGPDRITLNWSTASEPDAIGFNILRGTSSAGPFDRINAVLVPTKGSATRGSTYSYLDTAVEVGKTYYYRLENVDFRGKMVAQMMATATPGVQSTTGSANLETEDQKTPPPEDLHSEGMLSDSENGTSEQADLPGARVLTPVPGPAGIGSTEQALIEKSASSGPDEDMEGLQRETGMEPQRSLEGEEPQGVEGPTVSSITKSVETRPEEGGPEVSSPMEEGFRFALEDPSGNRISVDKVRYKDLPETARGFTGVRKDRRIVLTWVGTEKWDGYHVLRSQKKDGKYLPIHEKKVPAFDIAEKDRAYRYEFMDITAEAGKGYFYRLEGMAPDGKMKVLGEIEVKTVPQQKRMKVPPAKSRVPENKP